MAAIITLILVGISVGLSNFAASIAIGLGGIDKSLRLRVAVVFGLFETGMPLIGLLIGQGIANKLGGHANIIGGGLLGLAGIYLTVSSLKKTGEIEVSKATGGMIKLLVAALALSIDNLIVGFGLGTHHQPLLLAASVIGATSIGLSLVGLELGSRLGSKVEKYSEILSGSILIIIGILIITKIL